MVGHDTVTSVETSCDDSGFHCSASTRSAVLAAAGGPTLGHAVDAVWRVFAQRVAAAAAKERGDG
jgi:hypothetical protein